MSITEIIQDRFDSLIFLNWLRPDGPWSLTAIAPDGRTETKSVTWQGDFLATIMDMEPKCESSGDALAFLDEYEDKRDIFYEAPEFAHVVIEPKDGETLDQLKGRVLELAGKCHPHATIFAATEMVLLWRLENNLDPAAIEALNHQLALKLGGNDAACAADYRLKLPGTMDVLTKHHAVALRMHVGAWPLEAFRPKKRMANGRAQPVTMTVTSAIEPALVPNTLMAVALAYAAKGIPVFPCNKSKVPFKGSHGYKDATTDPEQIKRWWTQHPDACIAMPTGRVSGFDVLDLDNKPSKGKDGLAAVPNWESLTPTIAMTPSGGAHLYFKASGVSCSQGKIGPGVDTRGDGGHVLLPPSAGYTWLKGGIL